MRWIVCICVCIGSVVQCEENLSQVSLDAYLNQRGLFLAPDHSAKNEGYSSLKQRAEFIADLQRLPHVKKVLEIGFNAGHSAETFLNQPQCEKLVSFDINTHGYTSVGTEFMQHKFKERFVFVPGESKKQVPKYASAHPHEKFDLIFIDGGHAFDLVVNDIRNCQALADRNALVWLDDYETIIGVKAGVDECVDKGVIALLEVKSVTEGLGRRSWAIAQYTTPSERVFNNIYKKRLWGTDERGNAICTPGSSLENASPFIDYIEEFLEQTPDVQSILDVGCGDWALGRNINWGNREYLGVDVIRSLVFKNQAQFGNEHIRFAYLDAAIDPLPSADLLICKDVWIHLPNDMILPFLNKMKKFKYCILINEFNAPRSLGCNGNILLGDTRPIDVTADPFFLKPAKVAYYRSARGMKQVALIEN